MKNPLQEKYLIFRIKQNHDAEAYGKLYDLYVERIYRFIFFKVSNQEDAEDITSEVFLKTWQYIIKTDKRIASLNALLYKTARNAVIDHYRQKRRTDLSLSDQERYQQIVDKRDVEREVEVKMSKESFEQMLTHLKDEYREVIVLRHVEGMSTSEIADILQKSTTNVRVLLHRALKRLREMADNNNQ